MSMNIDKNSKIYIAGHTGLIGSAFVRKLQVEGYSNLVFRSHAQLDLTSMSEVTQFFLKERPEYVVLAAGKVGGIIENQTFPADFIATNLAIQFNVIQAAHSHEVRKLIFFGSSCMYPRQCPQPMAESALFSGIPEQTSMAYAVAKMAGVQMCLAYNQQYGVKRFIPVIPNSAYGPNDNFNPESGHVLSAFIRRFHEAKKSGSSEVVLWGSGSPRREFIHADDLADACIQLLSANLDDLDMPLNLGSGSDISIKELAEVVSGVVGYKGRLIWDESKPDGAPRKLLDSERIKRFGWSPKVDFVRGLQDTYEWYLSSLRDGKA
jgi:GDP-L-fucose synthase